jgi:hypothetical protein
MNDLLCIAPISLDMRCGWGITRGTNDTACHHHATMYIASYAFLVAERVVGVIHQLYLAPTFLSQSIIKISPLQA